MELRLMRIGSGVDHIAYATRNTDRTAKLFSTLGFEFALYKKPFPAHNIFASKLVNENGDVLELIEPMGPGSKIDEVVGDHDAMVYHVAFKVDDFNKTFRELIGGGSIVVTKPFESIIFPGYLVSHLYHENVGLFEIFGKDKGLD